MSKLINGAFKLGLSGAGQAILQILVTAYLARLLDPRDFGVVAAAMIVTDLLIGFSQVGLGQSLVQKRDISAVHIRTAFTVCLSLGVVGTVVVASLAETIAHFLKSPDSAPAIRLLSVGFILNNIGIVADSLAARDLRFELLARRRIIGYIVGYPIIGVISGIAGAGGMALVYANLGQIGATSAMMLLSSPHPKKLLVDRDAFRSMWTFGLGFSVARLANTFAAKVDQFVVARSFDLQTLGLYTRAHAIMRFPINTLGQIVEDVAFPSMSALQHEPAKISSSYLKTLAFANITMFPAALFVAVMAKEIVDVLLGKQWANTVPILMVLAFTLPLRSTQRLGSAMLRAMGHSWLVAGAQFVYLFAVMVGAYVGAQFGIVGSATGVSIAVLVQFLTLAGTLIRLTGISISEFAGAHFRAIPIIFLIGAVTYSGRTLCNAMQVGPFATLIVTGLLAGVTFAVPFFLAGEKFFGRHGLSMINTLRGKISNANPLRKI
jgi:O-antigen/teichoic acid export membrane protein